MEPAKATIKQLWSNYAVYVKVTKVEEFPQGWFVHFEGSWESICFGQDRPSWKVGDMVKITFEKQEPTDAKDNS